MNSSLKLQLVKILQDYFLPTFIDLQDDSYKHAGHAGANPQGGSHYSLLLVSNQFVGKSLIERQREVFKVLKELMEFYAIHAIAMKTYTEEEWRKIKNSTQTAV